MTQLVEDLPLGRQERVGVHRRSFAFLSPSSAATSRIAMTSSSVVR